MTRYEAASTAQITPGTMLSVTLGSEQVLIANVDGQFFALSDLCPHLAVPMSQGTLNGACVTCPGHGSAFDLNTGKVIKWIGREPGLLGTLLSGRSKRATAYAVSVEGDKIYVDL